MHSRSIKSQVLMTLISAMFIISVVVGGISVFEIEKLIGENATETMKVYCEKEAIAINATLKDIEETATTMAKYAVYDVSAGGEDVDHMANITRVFCNMANSTDKVSGVYFRLSGDEASAFHFVKVQGSLVEAAAVKNEYDEKSKWQKPYYNETTEGYLSVYEAPVYINNELYGLVGVELDCKEVSDVVDRIKIKDNGFAYLVKDGKIEYHRSLTRGADIPDTSKEYFEVSNPLENGTELVFAASYADMSQKKYEIIYKIWGIVILLALLFILAAYLRVRRIVKPLKALTEASDEISRGNYKVDIEKTKTKEIAALGRAFEKMAGELRENDMYMHRIAYRDPLTKLRNTAAYKAWMDEFDMEIKLQSPDFGVIVLDVNGLKEANDSLGHEVGDKLIFAAAQTISEVFRRSPVFRIGGDEFVVVLTGEDLENREELMEELNHRCNNGIVKADGGILRFSIAKGIAFFDRKRDVKYIDVFRRADDAMYEDKRKIKEER